MDTPICDWYLYIVINLDFLNFRMTFAYTIYCTTKIKQIMVYQLKTFKNMSSADDYNSLTSDQLC